MPSHSCASSLPHFSAHLIKTDQRTFSTERRLRISSEKHCWVVVMCLESAAEWALPGREKKPQGLRERKTTTKKTPTVSQAIFFLLNHSHCFEVTGFIDSGEARWLRPIRAFHRGEKPKKKKRKPPVHTATTRGRALLSAQSHSLFPLCWRLLWVRTTNHLRM